MESSQGQQKKILTMKEIPVETVVNNIDLLTEILLRLPTKPLVKFKCVSKQWLSLISDPRFCLSHTRHHRTPNSTPTALLLNYNYNYTPTQEFEIVLLKHNKTMYKVPFLDYLNVPRIKIRQSCNGLLLCTSRQRTFLQKWEKDPSIRYFICNPTTKQFKELSFPSHEFKDSVVALSLAFDPFKSIHYKVVSIRKVKEHRTRMFRIDMYSSKTDSWNLLGITFNEPHNMGFHNAVFCNGAIHWDSEDVISLYFDVDNECLKTMPLPALREDWHYMEVRYFGESCGHLHLVTQYSSPFKFDVLEMAADYSQWFVRYHVNLDFLRFEFSVLSVIRAENEEESMIVLFVDDTVISYNVNDGTSKKLCYLNPNPIVVKPYLDFEGLGSHQFFESLCCV